MTTAELQALQRKLRDLIAEDEVALAMSDLRTALPEGSKTAGVVVALQARQTDLNQRASAGILSTDERRQERAQIVYDLQQIIDGLTEEDFAAPAAPGASADTSDLMGRILYRIPQKMKVGMEKRCIVRLAYEKAVILQNIDYDDNTQDQAIRVARVMEVYLFEPVAAGDENFAIRTESKARQFLEKGFYTEWIFYAKPLREGSFPLKVRAVVVIKEDGEELTREIPFETTVTVIATEPSPEEAGANLFQTAGYALSFTSSSSSEGSVRYSQPAGSPAPQAAPSESRSKGAIALGRVLAYSIGLVMLAGIGAYLFTSPPVREKLLTQLLKNNEGGWATLIDKFKTDPDPVAQQVVDDATFEQAKASGKPSDFQAYLDKFAAGRHQTEVDDWLKTAEFREIEEIKKLLAASPVGSSPDPIVWARIRRFATEFGPSERLPLLLNEIKNRPDLRDEAPQVVERLACSFLEQHPRRDMASNFREIFPENTCIGAALDQPGGLSDGGSQPENANGSDPMAPPGHPDSPGGANPDPSGEIGTSTGRPNGASNLDPSGGNSASTTGNTGGINPNPATGKPDGQTSNSTPGKPNGANSNPTNGKPNGPNSNPTTGKPGGPNSNPTNGKPNGTTSGQNSGQTQTSTGSHSTSNPGNQPGGGSSSGLDFERNMVYVEGGMMKMGMNASTNLTGNETKNTEPMHDVHADGFYISKFEVTQAEWVAVMGANPSKFKGCDNCPVENVSFDDVQEFLKKLRQLTGKAYRLPSEAEWEWAARGGVKSQNFACSGSDDAEEVAWFDNVIAGMQGKRTHPVGGLKANELGLFDMSGNVREWCEDGWHDNYIGAPKHSVVWKEGGKGDRRVARGGSFMSAPPLCRTYSREHRARTARESATGFRLARD